MNALEPFCFSLDALIRPCRAEDLPTLEWFGLFTPHRQIIRDTFDQHCRGEAVMLVVDVNGVASGQAWIDLTTLAGESVGIIWGVRVFPCLQNRGLGSRLVAAGEQILQERGFRQAEVLVERDNPAARRLYERLGYRQVGQRKAEFAYVAPDGSPATLPLDQWVLRKSLEPEGRA